MRREWLLRNERCVGAQVKREESLSFERMEERLITGRLSLILTAAVQFGFVIGKGNDMGPIVTEDAMVFFRFAGAIVDTVIAHTLGTFR